jgi:hypothetical protein
LFFRSYTKHYQNKEIKTRREKRGMAIKFEEINMYEIFQDLGRICETQPVCTRCEQSGCLVEYAKACADRCMENGVTYVDHGMEGMPQTNGSDDYNELEILLVISHLLVQCRSCEKEHYDNCVINVLRNCMERITLGKSIPYSGVPMGYMMDFSKEDSGKANVIAGEYNQTKGSY